MKTWKGMAKGPKSKNERKTPCLLEIKRVITIKGVVPLQDRIRVTMKKKAGISQGCLNRKVKIALTYQEGNS